MAAITYTRTCLFCNNQFITADKNKKFCNLSCSTKNKNKVAREQKLKHYAENPKKCIHCNSNLLYNKRRNRFCSQSCGASYSNARKDWSKIKTGPKKGFVPHTYYARNPRYCKVAPCIICGKYHQGYALTCSPICKSKLISDRIKEKIHAGYDPTYNRGRHKKSYLELSFYDWLINNGVTNFETEKPFKRLDVTKTYFADFYFPDLSLIIELDGSQHKKTIAYDSERDRYISTTYNIEIIRVSHKEYTLQTKLDLIKSKLGLQ